MYTEHGDQMSNSGGKERLSECAEGANITLIKYYMYIRCIGMICAAGCTERRSQS